MSFLPHLAVLQRYRKLTEWFNSTDVIVLQSFDIFEAVERLHNLELSQLLPLNKGVTSKWIQMRQDTGPPCRISATKLLRRLPLHVMSCLLARMPKNLSSHIGYQRHKERHVENLDYHLHADRAVRLLCTLSHIIVDTQTPPECTTAMGPDRRFTYEVVDMVVMILLSVSGPEAHILQAVPSQANIDVILCRASLVQHSLRALALTTSFQAPPPAEATADYVNWYAVSEALLDHPRGFNFFDSAFESTQLIVKAVRHALLSSGIDGDTVYRMAYSAGGALELLTALCATPLFYHRLMIHDADGVSPLRLIIACLRMHDDPFAAPPFERCQEQTSGSDHRPVVRIARPPYTTAKGKGAAELLTARGFALFLQLAEYGDPSFLDNACSSLSGKPLADELVRQTASYVGQILRRPTLKLCPPGEGESQLTINVLRMIELLADDSNFRALMIVGLTPTLCVLLATTPTVQFSSLWVVGDEAVELMAGMDKIQIGPLSKNAFQEAQSYANASRELISAGIETCKPSRLSVDAFRRGRQLALERAILLTKLLSNLHFYKSDMDEFLKNRFLLNLKANLERLAHPLEGVLNACENVKAIFRLAFKFSGTEALGRIELISELDVSLCQDILNRLDELQTEALKAALANGVEIQEIHAFQKSAEGYSRNPPQMGFKK